MESALNESFVSETGSSAESGADVHDISPSVKLVFYCLYATVFSLAFVGNTFALITCYKRYKVTASILLCFIASLALADLMFTLLSIFTFIAVAGKSGWFGGYTFCKVHGVLIESCYTVSVLTLVAISRERLKAVSSPILTVAQGSTRRIFLLVVIWITGILTCTPLFNTYYVREDDNTGKKWCVTKYMHDREGKIYYSIQAGLLFLLPLGFMSFAHIRIFQLLSYHVRSINSNISNKQRQVAKMLALVTLVFFICYGTFMIIRALRYLSVYNGDAIWRLGQMMIFAEAAVNPIFYCLYSKQFRMFFKKLICWRFRTDRYPHLLREV